VDEGAAAADGDFLNVDDGQLRAVLSGQPFGNGESVELGW
jgi:hypothetical protein